MLIWGYTLKAIEENCEIVCLLCPIGCKINVKKKGAEIAAVENAGCKRGVDYSIKEIKSPIRDFFTTVRVKDGRIPMLSVRSKEPLPKEKLMECAIELSKLVVPAPIKIGDVIVKNIMNSGVDVIATKDVEKA